MLQAIRDGTRGWIAYVIVAVLAVPFALFGVYNYFTGGSNPAVAEVAGQEITAQQLDRAVQQQRQQLQRMLGERYDPAMFEGGALQQRALNQLINTAVVNAYASDEGLRVTSEQLRQRISQQSAFQVDGSFSQERYRTLLSQNNLTPQQYEARLGRDLAASQLQQGIAGSVLVTDAELQRFVALQRQQRDLAWLRVPASAFTDEFDPDEATLREYYEAHRSAWQRPQQVKLAYVELSREALREAVAVDEQAIEARYEKLKDSRFTTGGERRVRHILLELPDSADEQAVAAAREKAADIRERIASGELDFAAAATQYSDDPASAGDGGDLGWTVPGDLPGALGKAAFALEPGELSQPVRSAFGWHLVKVSDVRDQEVQPLEAVREELRDEIAAEEVDERFYELRNELANVAYENPDSLSAAADVAGAEIQHTDWISRQSGGEGIASNPAVREAAFSSDVLAKGLNSEVIELGEEGHLAVIRAAEQRPAKTLAFDEVEQDVRARWRADQAAEAARERGQALREQLAGGADAERLAADGDATYQDFGWVGRGSSELPAPVRERVFRMPHPQGETARELAGTSIGDGDYAVLILRGVRDGELADVPEQQREQLRQSLRQLEAASVRQAVVQVLRDQANVTIYEDRL